MTEEMLLAVNGIVFGVWFLIGAALVFWMQAGFAMVEAGFTRAKNTGNILMKNLMDFCIGTPMFVLIGFGLLLGEDMFGIIGKPGFDIFTSYSSFDWSNFVFNLVFCATTATIVSGAMAERTKFLSYCIYSAVISAVIYPVEAHWIWGGGWLSQLGFHDFAGSAAIHMVGGLCALVGAAMLGPRIGKYDRDSAGNVTRVNAFPGHNLPLGCLGCFILWLGWYGFNGAAATSVDQLGSIFLTTTIAPSIATVVCMIFTWAKYGKPDVSMCLNASLAGLVAITITTAFTIIKATVGLRVTEEEEIVGLDACEHGLPSAYAGFSIMDVSNTMQMDVNENTDLGIDEGAPVAVAAGTQAPAPMPEQNTGIYKVTIISRLTHYDRLKKAMNRIGVTGMTVTQVMGCGIQKGAGERYRGVEMDATLLPKVKVEVVVGNIPVDQIIQAAKEALYTGHIGDGKIFVYRVDKVVKVRTGEEDLAALNDME